MISGLEYLFAVKHIGKENILFTNFVANAEWVAEHGLNAQGESIASLPFDKSRVCLLDSEASDFLSPSDVHLFDYFVVGGILGNGTTFK